MLSRKILYPALVVGDAVVSALAYLFINNVVFGDKDYLRVGEAMLLLVPVALFIVVMIVGILIIEKGNKSL